MARSTRCPLSFRPLEELSPIPTRVTFSRAKRFLLALKMIEGSLLVVPPTRLAFYPFPLLSFRPLGEISPFPPHLNRLCPLNTIPMTCGGPWNRSQFHQNCNWSSFPMNQAQHVAGLSAVAAPSAKQLWRVGDLAKAGGFIQHPPPTPSEESTARFNSDRVNCFVTVASIC